MNVIHILMIIPFSPVISSLNISKGPQNTTVCMDFMAECECGFTGATVGTTMPDWRIVYRSDSGSIIYNTTIDGRHIFDNKINGLKWLPDYESGPLNATNSKLLVGPVNMTHNQSSYQCMFSIGSSRGRINVMSSVGTMTVVDPLSAKINVDKVCATSLDISLDAHSHLPCGNVSHIVNINGIVLNPDANNSSIYLIDGLQNNVLHNITIISTHNGDTRMHNKSLRTLSLKSPNSIDKKSINFECVDACRLVWKSPEINSCIMSAIEYYDVTIYSDEDYELSVNTSNTSLLFEHQNNYSTISYTVSIIVVDIDKQKSNPTVITKTFGMSDSPLLNDEDEHEDLRKPDDENIQSANGSSTILIVVVAVVVVIGLFIIILIVIMISYIKYRHSSKKIDVCVRKKTEDNCYDVGTDNESLSHDLTSPYAVSGPSPAWPMENTHSNAKDSEVESVHEPSTHSDHVDKAVCSSNIDEDEYSPPLPPKLNYAEVQFGIEMPKFMKPENHVTYVETKPA